MQLQSGHISVLPFFSPSAGGLICVFYDQFSRELKRRATQANNNIGKMEFLFLIHRSLKKINFKLNVTTE